MRGLAILGLLCGCRQLLGLEGAVIAGDATQSDTSTLTDAAVDTPAPPPVFVRRIDIAGQVTGGPHVDFPLLVAITDPFLRSRANGGDVASEQGFDLVFTADEAGTTQLAHEVESYDPDDGSFVAWVKIPSLTTTSSVFLGYGNPAITTSQQNAPAVWSADYAGVWHLTSGLESITQTTANDVGTIAATGKIGAARRFDGTNSRLEFSTTAAITNVFDGGGTIEAWFLAEGSGESGLGRLADKGEVQFGLGDTNLTNSFLWGHSFSNNGATWNTAPNTVAKNTLTHVAVVYNALSAANDPTIYINAAVRNPVTGVDPAGTRKSDATFDLIIGNRLANDRAFDGIIDELRLSRTTRTAGWIATQFANQNAPGTFITVSAPL